MEEIAGASSRGAAYGYRAPGSGPRGEWRREVEKGVDGLLTVRGMRVSGRRGAERSERFHGAGVLARAGTPARTWSCKGNAQGRLFENAEASHRCRTRRSRRNRGRAGLRGVSRLQSLQELIKQVGPLANKETQQVRMGLPHAHKSKPSSNSPLASLS